MQDSPGVVPVVACLAVIYVISKWFSATTHQLKHIPTIGSSGVISSYRDVFKFFRHGHEMVQEGYDKYYGSAFKIPQMSKWVVVVSGPQMVDDIRRASEEHLSFDEAVAETLQIDYTLGPQIRINPYHIATVRTPMTRNIAVCFEDIKDEINLAFNELIPVKGNEWTTVPAFKTLMKIVCRTSNRFFIGAPLCRDPDYRELNEQFTIDVFVGAQIINLFPRIVKPIVGRYLTKVRVNTKRGLSHLRPLIEKQLEQEEKYGKDWPDKPNNMISWLLEDAQGPQRGVEELTNRLLTINVAAIHTTTNALTRVMYYLAAYPEYVAPMREEVAAAVEAEGWSKSSLGKMRKVDSFVKESQRLTIGAIGTNRKVLKDFTFSNGITVPAGAEIAVATYATHMDEKNYENAHKFQGFRYAEMRDEVGESIKHQFVSLSPDSLTFGTGRHACPGRFFAANEVKAVLAHTLLNYDVKLDGPLPETQWFFGQAGPDRHAQLMFRKRVA